jgi:hypothetical protein
VAPPGNQAANRENKLQPIATGGPGLLDRNLNILEPVFSKIPEIYVNEILVKDTF